MASTSTSQSLKRKATDIIVDPDTQKTIEDAKKPKIDLNASKKFACISSIVEMHDALAVEMFKVQGTTGVIPMETSDSDVRAEDSPAYNITVGNHLISIIFTVHNVSRQKTKQKETNMIKKTEKTSYNARFKGKDYSLSNDTVTKMWTDILSKHDLEYKDYAPEDEKNWYGTMGPYLDMFSAYALRVNELRLGHNNMPITKVDGIHKSFPVSKYGLSGAHHVLLEGASFPPERRSSIVQSIGPMTAWLCMIRSEGLYRRKYATAVKRAMSHVPCIDDIIELTKQTRQASEIASLTTLVAEILLVTTSRQATRMFFPITVFAHVWRKQTDKTRFCNFFSTTGAGGWYTYKLASTSKQPFYVSGSIEEEMAAQIVFHGIFGTFKEDLSILSQITSVANWFTREQMGGCFRQTGNAEGCSKVVLPVVNKYAKMSCANQSGLLSGVYNQIVTVPCFSGHRTHLFDATFFEHIEKKRIISNNGKTLAQIINILTSTLEELHDKLKKENGKIEMGTTLWRDMKSLNIDHPGDEDDIRIVGTNKMFLGKN